MNCRGYSLIELMITIAVLAFLAVVAMPMGSQWVKDSSLEETEGKIMQALGQAKASGLRNPAAKTGDALVAIVCIDTSTDKLWLMESTATVEANCDTTNTATKLWQTELHEDLTVTDASNSNVTCLCTNNKGLLINSGTCSACYTGNQLKLAAGSSNRFVAIF